jgi:serine/threonine-protein kinase
VSEAHRAGIVHRDLKPSNIFLCWPAKGIKTACVLDFGISKVGGLSSSALTQTGDIVGTSQYLSPEQASGTRQVTELSDVYSLGVVMFECVTQQTPQRGQPLYDLLRNVSEGRHARPHELRGDLPPAFEAIIERAMMVRPQDRFATVLDLATALFLFASPEGQRLFSHLCGPARSAAQSGPSLPSPASAEGARLPATERFPVVAPPSWHNHTTRTALRASARRQGCTAGRLAAEPTVLPSRLRTTLVSIALGAILASAILLALGWFFRFP